MKKKKILVLSSGGPAGVNFINSLRDAQEQFHIIAADKNRFHLEWALADEKYLIPDSSEKSYIQEVNNIIKKTKADFLHPQSDSEVFVISENREKILTHIFLPKKKTIRICQDKYQSAVKWRDSGIKIAKTLFVSDDKSLREAESIFGYPYWIRASQGASSRGSTPVNNIDTARAWISYWKSRGIQWKFIAQEMLPGRNIAFQSLWNDGKLIVSSARERLEYLYPQLAPSGVTNTPVIARTIHDDRVNDIAKKAVLSIDSSATGIFCVDIKENKKEEPIPTEINAGRFFTTSYFFTKAGVNMPYYYVKLGLGEKIPKLLDVNALPENWYWLRHIDCPPILLKSPEYAKKN